MQQSIIPSIWKSSIIIPLPKPGKDPGESKSYRPVSLLCPAIKILERLILPTLTETLPIPDFQHGFRKKHSTVTALHDFNQAIAKGFNKKLPPDRTILLQIDMSKAFDMVSHNKLLKDLHNTNLPPALKRWFNCYLRGRQSRVKFRNHTSTSRNVKTGVPQGAVTSPILFNFYLSKLPTPPSGIHVIQYADDISIYCSGTDIESMSLRITEYMKEVKKYLDERELLVAPEKSTVTLFSPDTKDYKIHPKVLISGELVALEHNPKLLGVTFDTMYTFSHHVTNTINKSKSKLNVLKAVAGSSWGQEKETMVMLYKTCLRSNLEYAATIWTPSICETNWTKLAVPENQGLKIAIGCLKMAHTDHIHQETLVLPLRKHCRMLCKQFLAQCHLPGHPGAKHLNRPPDARNMKSTVLEYLPEVANFFHESPVSESTYKSAITSLHTNSVQEAISSYLPNKVLNTNPPKINPEEKKLHRKMRSLLSQLRSGFSRRLNHYMHIIDETIPDTCPLCSGSLHDTKHLFDCPSKPTVLNVTDLWTKPILAAEFLTEMFDVPGDTEG